MHIFCLHIANGITYTTVFVLMRWQQKLRFQSRHIEMAAAKSNKFTVPEPCHPCLARGEQEEKSNVNFHRFGFGIKIFFLSHLWCRHYCFLLVCLSPHELQIDSAARRDSIGTKILYHELRILKGRTNHKPRKTTGKSTRFSDHRSHSHTPDRGAVTSRRTRLYSTTTHDEKARPSSHGVKSARPNPLNA